MDGAPRVTLVPVASPGRTEITRELSLKYTHKVGRSVPNKPNCKTAVDNAIFDSKVLSRSHAEIWHDDGKVYIKDTGSSNGTYINNQRLSPSGKESPPVMLSTGDMLKLGVDVLEHNTAAHKCVQLEVTVHLPTDGPSKSQQPQSDGEMPVTALVAMGEKALVKEVLRQRKVSQKYRKETQSTANELVNAKQCTVQLGEEVSRAHSSIREADAAYRSVVDAKMHEDKLLSRIETMEAQLEFYMRLSSRGAKDAGLVTEVELLSRLADAEQNRHTYEMAAKEMVKQVTKERHEAIQKLHEVRQRQTVERREREVKLSQLKFSIEQLEAEKQELLEKLHVKYEEVLAEVTGSSERPGSTSLGDDSASPCGEPNQDAGAPVPRGGRRMSAFGSTAQASMAARGETVVGDPSPAGNFGPGVVPSDAETAPSRLQELEASVTSLKEELSEAKVALKFLQELQTETEASLTVTTGELSAAKEALTMAEKSEVKAMKQCSESRLALEEATARSEEATEAAAKAVAGQQRAEQEAHEAKRTVAEATKAAADAAALAAKAEAAARETAKGQTKSEAELAALQEMVDFQARKLETASKETQRLREGLEVAESKLAEREKQLTSARKDAKVASDLHVAEKKENMSALATMREAATRREAEFVEQEAKTKALLARTEHAGEMRRRKWIGSLAVVFAIGVAVLALMLGKNPLWCGTPT